MLVLYISNRTINTKQQQGSLFVPSEVFLVGYDLIWCRETENLENKSRFVFSRQQSLDDNLVKKTPRHREYIRIKQGWTLLRHFSLLQKSVFFPWKYIFQYRIFTTSINIIFKQYFECSNFFLRCAMHFRSDVFQLVHLGGEDSGSKTKFSFIHRIFRHKNLGHVSRTHIPV